MIDKQISWAITLGEVLEISNNENVCIPICFEDYDCIFNNNKTALKMKKMLYSNIFLFNDILDNGIRVDSKYKLNPSISMYPNADKTNYKIGYNIARVFNSSLEKLGVSSYLYDFDYNNKQDIKLFKDKLESTIKDGLMYKILFSDDNDVDEKDKIQILINLEKNMDLMVNKMIDTNKELDSLIKTQVIEQKEMRDNSQIIYLTSNSIFVPKNLMLYSAVKSLSMFNKTGDIDYYKYAKDYYRNISNREDGVKPEWTNNIFIGKQKYRYDFSTYNEKFETVRDYYFPKLYVDLGIEDKKKITLKGKTLKKGINNQVIKLNGASKPKKEIDYNKINKALDRKITFYKDLKNVGIIDSTNKDVDYIGFILDNNYVILDKFYDYDKKGNIKKVALNNAIYVVTLDVLKQCNLDKKTIRNYIEKNRDFKAYRLYHNDTDSYQEKVNKVLTYKPISTIDYKDYLNNEKNN